VLVAVVAIVWLLLALRGGSATRPLPDGGVAPPPPPDAAPAPALASSPLHELELAALERRLHAEHRRYLAARRRARQLTRTLQHRPGVAEALNLACVVYGSCDTLWRRARCETGGTFSPRAYNASSRASGLLQFLPATWRSTPFGRFSVWSPYANALAAGWMITHGRGGEWECR
jgi:hypothetical protein